MDKLALGNKIAIIVAATIALILAVGTICFAVITMNNKEEETISEYIYEPEENILEEENVIEEEIIEESTEENKKDDKQKKTVISAPKYYIKVNVSQNVVYVYEQDGNGNPVGEPVRTMVCSTGTETPWSGKYKLSGAKHRWHTLFHDCYGQWTTSIVGDILFHSVPYSRYGDPSSLIWSYYDKLGTRASAGCIRLTTRDAKWIYDNIVRGTIVEFYSGPLVGAKPTAQKISNDTIRRGWDPTDVWSQGNPWNGYVAPSEPVISEQPVQPEQQPVQPTTPSGGNEVEKPSGGNITSGGETTEGNTTQQGTDNETSAETNE